MKTKSAAKDEEVIESKGQADLQKEERENSDAEANCHQPEIAPDKILDLCGWIAYEAETKEADQMYKEAEQLYIKGIVSDLYAHYVRMKEICKPRAKQLNLL